MTRQLTITAAEWASVQDGTLIADLRAKHQEAEGWCVGCCFNYPCPTIRLIDTAEERA